MNQIVTPWAEIDRLADLVEAEIAGNPLDRDEACELARSLADRHPEIAGSLNMIRARMAGEA